MTPPDEKRLRYKEPEDIGLEEAFVALESDDPNVVTGALVRVALNWEYWTWMENTFVRMTRHPEPHVCAIAATCLGHLGRRRGKLDDPEEVVGTLRRLEADPDIGAYATSALDDLGRFVPEVAAHLVIQPKRH